MSGKVNNSYSKNKKMKTSPQPFIKEKTILMMEYLKNFQCYSGWNLFFNSSNRGLPGDFSNNSLKSSFAFSVFPVSE
jgi:hypothetical protein